MSARDTVTVPATMAGVRQAADIASAWTERLVLPLEVRRRVLTTLDEVLSNIVHHGVRGRPGVIQMTLAYEASVLEVELTDDADPFNPLLVPAPDVGAAIEDRAPGGLGIALVRALADDVRYERRADRNIVTMRFDAHSGTRGV
jgi:anti-sigma regulatory factor (Ser/Thr protein kinase)